MDDRFDRLEQKLDEQFKRIDQKFERIDQKFERIDQRFERIDQRFAEADSRMTLGFGSVNQRLDDLSERVGVLHEDVKRDFRFSLEAQQGLKEQMDAGFAAHTKALEDALAPIRAAVRIAHRR